jgi:peptidoglycan/xylan/chitin deacetylase (PgdA/CDA1 family)
VEIEKGVSAVHWALGAPSASFVRFPALRHPPEAVAYVGERNMAVFSADIDSLDFKIKKPEHVIKSVMKKLEKNGKGIILMHDFQRATAHAMPELLRQLKANGYKIAHMTSKAPLPTLEAYDAEVMKELGGTSMAGANAQSTKDVVQTISGD